MRLGILINRIAAKAGKSQSTTRAVLDALIDHIKIELSKGAPVQVYGLGKFSSSDCKERSGVNPQTKTPIVIPAHKKIRFTPSTNVRSSIR